MAYSSLDADRIEATLVTLSHRIEERFPNRGLTKLCQHLLAIAREDKRTLAWVAKPNVWLRAGVAVAIISGIAGLIWFAFSLPRFRVEDEVSNVLQGVDAAVNTLPSPAPQAGSCSIWNPDGAAALCCVTFTSCAPSRTWSTCTS